MKLELETEHPMDSNDLHLQEAYLQPLYALYLAERSLCDQIASMRCKYRKALTAQIRQKLDLAASVLTFLFSLFPVLFSLGILLLTVTEFRQSSVPSGWLYLSILSATGITVLILWWYREEARAAKRVPFSEQFRKIRVSGKHRAALRDALHQLVRERHCLRRQLIVGILRIRCRK